MSSGPWRRPLSPAAPQLRLHVVFTTGPADRVVPTLLRIGEGVAENREPQRGESETSLEKRGMRSAGKIGFHWLPTTNLGRRIRES